MVGVKLRVTRVKIMDLLNTTRLFIAGIGSLVVGVFVYLFKARGETIDEQEDEIQDLKNDIKFKESVYVVSKEVEQKFTEEEKDIEEEYNEKEEIIYKSNDKPLPPTLLSKLRDIQGLSNNNSNTSE